MKNIIGFIIFYLGFGTCPKATPLLQEKGGREAAPPIERPKTTRTTRLPPKPKLTTVPKPKGITSDPVTAAPTLADLNISVSPSDSIIWLNGQQFDYREKNGTLMLTGVKPGSYTLVVTKTNYIEYRNRIDVKPGQLQSVPVVLKPMPGNLDVIPSLPGTEIVVTNKADNSTVGSYTERINEQSIAPGWYQVFVSKSGYRTAIREITVPPAGSVHIEVPLEPLPVEKPHLRPDLAMAVQTSSEGKYFLISLSGKSGDPSRQAGSIDVTLSMNDVFPSARNVRGMLSGFPCRVDFVRIENVAEFSFSEPPGTGNQWERVVVRVRPKDSRRPIHFSINWSSLQSQSEVTAPSTSSPTTASRTFVQAVILKKVTPSYPEAARHSRMSGQVIVSVEIDERGNVTSAKMIDGHAFFRQAAENAARQWKFRPASVDGQPTSSTTTIQFLFRP